MANYFNAEYYFAAKAKQLSTTEKTWTAAEVQAEFAKQGIKAEDHYKAYGASEGLSPNAYFNEKEYLASKLAALQDNDPTWANKTVADLQAEFKALGINAADHYEQYGAFETRKDGTLLNPSNAFDANAYFAAKLAQLQKIGFEGADTMTVADVVKAVKEAGISPVAHLQAYGATEAKTDGIPLVQTVPVAQRVPNDPIRAQFGELVPSNYNPPSKAPAAAVAAPVTKPADVGGLSATKPVVPTAPVKVPGDTGYIAPPANLVDTNEKPVLPPTTTEGTGPNTGFIVVDPTTGKGTVIDPATGAEKGTVDVVVKDGVVTPPAPNAPVVDKDGNNINDKPADDTGKPMEPTPPTVDPEPEPEVPAPVNPYGKTVTVPATDPTGVANSEKIMSLLNDVTTANQKDGVLYTGGTAEDAKGKYELTVAKSDTAGKMPGDFKVGDSGDRAAATNLHGTKLVAKDLNVKSMNVALVDEATAARAAIAADGQVISLALKGNVTIGDVSTAGYIAKSEDQGFIALDKAGAKIESVGNYKYNMALDVSGAGNAIQMNGEDIAPSIIKVTGGAGSALRLDNVLAKNISGSTTEYHVQKEMDFTLEAVLQTGSMDVDLARVKDQNGSGGAADVAGVLDKLVLVDDHDTASTATTVALGNHKTTIELASYTGKQWDQNLTITGHATADDELTLTRTQGTGSEAISGGAIVVNLGSGSNTLTMDYSLLGEMKANSGFSGSSEVLEKDTLKLTGAKLTTATDVAFTDFGLTNVDVIDVSAIDSSTNALTLDVTAVATALAISGVSTTDQQLVIKTDTDAKDYAVTTGSGDDSVTFTSDVDAAFTSLKLVADLGNGDNTLTIDIAGQSTADTITFAADSKFTGGSGADTLALKGAIDAAFTADFTNLTLTDVEELDLSAVTGMDTTTNKLTLDLSDQAAGLDIAGASGSAVSALVIKGKAAITNTVTTGTGDDSVEGTTAGALTVNTGKGADTVTLLTSNNLTDTITLTASDFFTPHTESVSGSGSFVATNLDTISNFVSGTTNGDKLAVSSHITLPTATITAITDSGSAAVVENNSIKVITDADLTSALVTNSTDAFAALFSTDATKYLQSDGITEQTKAVVVVQGDADTYVFYIDSAADGTKESFSAKDIAHVATIDGISGGSTAFTLDNFA